MHSDDFGDYKPALPDSCAPATATPPVDSDGGRIPRVSFAIAHPPSPAEYRSSGRMLPDSCAPATATPPVDSDGGRIPRVSLAIAHPPSPAEYRSSSGRMLPDSCNRLFVFYLRRHAAVMTINCVSVFMALHANRLLKNVVSPGDDQHGSVIGTCFTLICITFACLCRLAWQFRRRPRLVWVVGLVSGHIMGFSSKQIYVALVRTAVKTHIDSLSVSVVWISLPVLGFYIFVLRRAMLYGWKRSADRWEQRGQRRCCCCDCNPQARAANNEAPRSSTGSMLQRAADRRRVSVVVREALDDSFAVAMGYAVFACCYASATYIHPATLQGVFEEESECYREATEESVGNHTGTHNLPGPAERETDLRDLHNFSICFAVCFVLFPLVHYWLRHRGHQKLVKFYGTQMNARKQMWMAQAGWLHMTGTAVAFALGFSVNKLMSFPLEGAAEDEHTTNANMLLWIALNAAGAWVVSTSSQTMSAVKHTLRVRREAARGEAITGNACQRWRVLMLVPTATTMWIMYTALSFEAFFDCAQYETVQYFEWPKTVAKTTALLVALCSETLVTLCCGHALTEVKEDELYEEVEMEQRFRYRQSTGLAPAREALDDLLLGIDSAIEH